MKIKQIKPYSQFETQELIFTINRALKSIDQLNKSKVALAKWSVVVLKDNIKAMNEILLKRVY